MSASFDKYMAGYQIGASSPKRFFITMLSLCLVGYNAVHMHDYAMVMFVNENTGFIKEISIRFAAVGLAFIEIIVGGVFVYLYRTSESRITAPLLLVGGLALVVASMAVVAGNGSQQSKADVKTNKINAYETRLTEFDDRIAAANSQLDIALNQASQLDSSSQRELEKDRAWLDFNNRVAKIKNEKAAHQDRRPIQPFANDSAIHYISITLFSILCSFGALFLSGYSAAFLTPLVAIPAFTLIAKLRHQWNSDGSDFQTVKHVVSPLGGVMKGLIGAQKAPAESTPPAQEKASKIPANDDTKTSVSSKSSKSRPQPASTGVGAVSNTPLSPSVRTQEEGGIKEGGSQSKKGDHESQFREYMTRDYLDIERSILEKRFTPTIRPIKLWLKERKVGLSDEKRQEHATEALEKMYKKGILKLNDKQRSTNKLLSKYVLNPDYEEDGMLGEFDIVSTCPRCSFHTVIDVVDLVDERKGLCNCANCNHRYAAGNHITPGYQNVTNSLLAKAKASREVSVQDQATEEAPATRASRVTPFAGAGVSIGEDGLSPVAGIGAVVNLGK